MKVSRNSLRSGRVWRPGERPARNVPGRVEVRVGRVPTALADKAILALAVCFFAMPALGTGSARVPRVDHLYHDSGDLCFVSDELAELVEGPGTEVGPLLASNRYPVADAIEIFKSDAAPGAFREGNEPFGYYMVEVAGVSLLTTGKALCSPFGRACSLGRQSRPLPPAALPEPSQVPALVHRAVRVHGDVLDTQINAQEPVWSDRLWLGYLDVLEQVELSFGVRQSRLCAPRLQPLQRLRDCLVWDAEPTGQRPDRDCGVFLPRQDTTVERHRPANPERAERLAQLVAVRDLCDHPHRQLCRQAERGSRFAIDRMMECIPMKTLGRERDPANVVGGEVRPLDCFEQGLGLFLSRQQLDLDGQDHNRIVPQEQP